MPMTGHPDRTISIGAAAVLAVSGLFLVVSEIVSFQRHERAASENLQNLTQILERQLFHRFQSCDLALQRAAAAFREAENAGVVDLQRFNDEIREVQDVLPGRPDIRAADLDGTVRYGGNVDPAKPLSIAARRFFKETVAQDGLVFGLALKSRISQRWVIPVSRPLHTAGGKLAGVVYVNVEMNEVHANLQALKLGETGIASVLNARGEILVRSLDSLAREDEAPRLASHETRHALASGQRAAQFESVSPLDGVRRTLLTRQVGTYPLYVAVGLEPGEYMMPWYREVFAAALFWLLLAIGAVVFVRMHGRTQRLEAERLAALVEGQRHAEEASRSKSLFLANASHEIRTPLNGILGFAQIGSRIASTSPNIQRLFEQIVDSGKLLQGILNDVLDMSKIEAGKLQIQLEPTDLRGASQRAIELVKQVAVDKGLELQLIVDPSAPGEIATDPLRLQQILLNLLSNAVKFTDCGRVSLHLAGTDNQAFITIRDTGVGMSDEQLRRLFLAFEQADVSTSRKYGGTGLGLAISKRLAELMGGTIEASSTPAVGSTFCLKLPLDACATALVRSHMGEQESPAAAEEETVPGRLSGMRLLVVDDNSVNRLVMEAMLQLEGAEVELASDGIQAIERLRTSGGAAFDAVLLDVMMPGIDGYETARRIRMFLPELPLIAATAHAFPEELERCLQSGMVDRVVKPVSIDQLVVTVRRHAVKA